MYLENEYLLNNLVLRLLSLRWTSGGGGGTLHMKGVGMLGCNFELNP